MDTVQVAVRVRPMVSSELEKGCREVVNRVPGEPQVILNNDQFTYNYVFGAKDCQEKVYDESVLPIIGQLLSGFNVTILAYGQTGSGKTYTMGTAFNGELNENAGVIPRAIHYIFQQVQELEAEYTFDIKCCFLDLYQEQLYDLLADKPREQSIVEIREDRNGICIPDLTYEVVHSAQETTNYLMRGSAGRAVASTAMNEHSSRSHAIFTVIITSIKKDESQALTTSKFHLVDLAGSERSKKTKATGDRFKEGVKINHGLLALGNVISALGSEKNVGFVRYRDSKLTRLLQDSLGGNSITLMIACISPADYNTPETLSTLRYADRARKIKNKPIVNQDPHAAEVNHLKSIIQKLRMELLATKSGSDSSLDTMLPGAHASPRKTYNDKAYRDLQEKYRNLQQKLQKTLHDVMENEMCVQIAEEAHAKLKAKTDELKIVAEELTIDMEHAEAISLPEHMNEHRVKINRLVQMVISINDEVEKTVSEINEHKHQTALNVTDNSDCESELGEEGGAEIEKEADVYNNKQFNIKEQLCRINHELNLKEQLQQRIANNLNKFCTLDSSTDDKFEEYQKKIRELEDEKTGLLDKLNHVKNNASAKLAEERRKRLQTLEHEITSMKNKIKQQSNLLKVREKETQKIQNLSKEIQAMKESKVKLIRTMRQEAENFRQWKLKREKELIQIKTKGRKMENEMVRKEALHTKQRNVLKRKCEEAMAINKRLKDALERQSAAQAMRQKQLSKDNNSRRIEQVIATVERELEVITSLIDAEQSLEHLMEDRSIINRRITELRENDPASQEINQLQEEYEMRNAQITELQQKVCIADLDARMRGLCDCMQNMAEARSVAKQLVNTVCDMRREYANRLQEQKVALDEKRAQFQLSEEEYQLTSKRLASLEKAHREQMVAIERTYEEKIALLLSELHSKTTAAKRDLNGENASDNVDEPTSTQKECFKIEEDLLGKMDSMREELEYYKHLVANMSKATEKKTTKPKMKAIEDLQQEQAELIELSTTEDENVLTDFDGSDDPDWKMDTPAPRKRKRSQQSHRNIKSTQSNNSDTSTNVDDTYVTATSQPAANGHVRGLKRKGKGCRCRNKCKNKQCGCRGANLSCTSDCQCGNECCNGKQSDFNADDADDELQGTVVITNRTYDVEEKENIATNIDIVAEKRVKTDKTADFLKPSSPVTSPERVKYMDEKARKMARLTSINFNTPTSKKKFFE